MMQRPLPEAICGIWFLFKHDDSFERAQIKKTYEVLTFRLNGTFARQAFKEGHKREYEQGDYTFDGEFLITRGRNTETYRVKPAHYAQWELESRKTVFLLQRTPCAFGTWDVLEESARRDLRILPIRVSIEQVHPNVDLYALTYGAEGATSVLLGYLSLEQRVEHSKLWVGVMRLVEGLEPESWYGIARDGLVDLHLGKPKGFDTLDVQFFDSGLAHTLEL